ncbi:MAG: DUF3617 family protein [Hyphomonadaceae bacterium]
MLRFIVPPLLAFGFTAATSVAQTYSVQPGQWDWQVDGIVAGAPMPFEGSDCIASGDAELDFDQLVAEAAQSSCTLERGAIVGNRTDFTLSCDDGEFVFSAKGTVNVEREKVTLKADGFLELDGLGEVPASVEATAVNTGQCPAP